jgi:hypothetical protein
MKKFLFVCLLVFVAIGIGLGILAGVNARELARRNRLYDSAQLGPSEKAALQDVQQLHTSLGEDVWPGFAQAQIPIILFNDSYEFLVGTAQAPPPWEGVSGDEFNGQSYFRRRMGRPNYFAVKIGEQWVGSIGSREQMNREALRQVHKQLPPIVAYLFPYVFATIPEDFHAVATLHEMFHAYQAQRSEKRFRRAESVYAQEKKYPFREAEFAKAWDQEGAFLSAALDASSKAAAVESVRQFLSVRDARRARAAFTAEMLDFERELEWLEGLAKYAEMRFHELAAAKQGLSTSIQFRQGAPYWWDERRRLRSHLGEQHGDFRFYLSGMAQARLLDRLAPGWKNHGLEDGVFLEDLLRQAVTPDQPKNP